MSKESPTSRTVEISIRNTKEDEIKEWIGKVFPDPEIHDHAIKTIASTLRGKDHNGDVVLITGHGDNSKTMSIKEEVQESKALNPKRTLNIYIRHADKLHDNSKKRLLGFDPDLKEGQKDFCHSLAKELIDMYGYPSIIRTSPFLRARRTADHLQGFITRQTQSRSYIKGSIKVPKIEIRTELSEYLGNQKDITREDIRELVTPDTYDHEFPIETGIKDLIARTQDILDMQQIPDQEDEKMVIWNISHGVVINRLRKQLCHDSDHQEKLRYLEFGLLLSEGNQIQWMDSDAFFTWDSISKIKSETEEEEEEEEVEKS